MPTRKNRKSRKSLTKQLLTHKPVTILAVMILMLITTATTVSLINRNTLSNASTQQLGVKAPEKAPIEAAVVEGDKLDISQAAIDGSTPTATKDGSCSRLYADEAGNYSVTVRQSDGSYKCLTFKASDLQSYNPATPTGTSSSTVIGAAPTQSRQYTDSETGITTTITNYSDGSTITSSNDYHKAYFDSGRTFYIMVNSTDMMRRFEYCMTTNYINANGVNDTRLRTPEEQLELLSHPDYPYAGPDCDDGNMPVVYYE